MYSLLGLMAPPSTLSLMTSLTWTLRESCTRLIHMVVPMKRRERRRAQGMAISCLSMTSIMMNMTIRMTHTRSQQQIVCRQRSSFLWSDWMRRVFIGDVSRALQKRKGRRKQERWVVCSCIALFPDAHKQNYSDLPTHLLVLLLLQSDGKLGGTWEQG